MRTCKTCGETYALTEVYFRIGDRYKDGYRPHCRKCENTYSIIKRDKETHNAWIRERRRDNKLKAIEYKGGKCSVCGNTFHPAVYDFHHLDPSIKDANPTVLLKGTFEDALSELDKCILVCSNCHRLIHHEIK